MVTQPEIIMIGNEGPVGIGIMFLEFHFSDEVGAAMEVHQAYQVTFPPFQAPKSIGKQLEYEELKAIYRTIEGRARRLRFWSCMIEHSPESQARRFEAQRADAISRVI